MDDKVQLKTAEMPHMWEMESVDKNPCRCQLETLFIGEAHYSTQFDFKPII